MGNTTDQAEGALRRRSLLPQRSCNRQGTTTLDVLTEHQTHESGRGIAQPSDRFKVAQASHRRTTSLLPPSRLGKSQLIREPARTPLARRPSTSKPCSQDSFKPSARVSSSSAGQGSNDNVKTSSHGRSVSQQIEHSTTPAATIPTKAVKRRSSTKGHRPQFTARQQTFTPKELVVSRPASPSLQSVNEHYIPSANTFHLQLELAQLHLLHRSAQSIQSQWERSAEVSFQLRFAALAERHAELKEIAQQQQKLVNQLALARWSDSKPSNLIAEEIVLLSRNITEICSLLEKEGKYTRILEVFESWFGQVLEIREKRKVESSKDTPVDFVEGIGDGWKAEATVLERELTYYSRDLKACKFVRADSSLGRVRSLYSKLVFHLIEEIDVIQWIENEITIQETFWVENTIQKLASGIDNDIGSMASMQMPS